jgi:hypothetical protein
VKTAKAGDLRFKSRRPPTASPFSNGRSMTLGSIALRGSAIIKAKLKGSDLIVTIPPKR